MIGIKTCPTLVEILQKESEQIRWCKMFKQKITSINIGGNGSDGVASKIEDEKLCISDSKLDPNDKISIRKIGKLESSYVQLIKK